MINFGKVQELCQSLRRYKLPMRLALKRVKESSVSFGAEHLLYATICRIVAE